MSRPTAEGLLRVLRDHHEEANLVYEDGCKMGSPMEASAYLLRGLLAAAMDALAALPAEQAAAGCGCWYAAEDGVACEHEPQERSDEQPSAVPELPPPLAANHASDLPADALVVPLNGARDWQHAAEALRERLGAALLGRSRAIARAEQAEQRLREVERSEQQAPFAWVVEWSQPHPWRDHYTIYGSKQDDSIAAACEGFVRQLPVYAAPPSAAAARREALLEVAQECERRIQKWNDSLLHGVAAWCRERAEEVQP